MKQNDMSATKSHSNTSHLKTYLLYKYNKTKDKFHKYKEILYYNMKKSPLITVRNSQTTQRVP